MPATPAWLVQPPAPQHKRRDDDEPSYQVDVRSIGRTIAGLACVGLAVALLLLMLVLVATLGDDDGGRFRLRPLVYVGFFVCTLIGVGWKLLTTDPGEN